jgi:hypothetical protein
VWTTFSAPSSVTSSTRTGSCARNDTSFAAALAVCSEADSKSVFGLSQRTLNLGIWMLLNVSDELPRGAGGACVVRARQVRVALF